jgi:hypothetical protein
MLPPAVTARYAIRGTASACLTNWRRPPGVTANPLAPPEPPAHRAAEAQTEAPYTAKHLHCLLPQLVKSNELHGHLHLEQVLRTQMYSMSSTNLNQIDVGQAEAGQTTDGGITAQFTGIGRQSDSRRKHIPQLASQPCGSI